MDDPEEKDPRSWLAEIGALKVVETCERDVGYNGALRDVLEILKQHEEERQRRAHRAITQRKKAGKKIGGDVPYGYELAPDGETLREAAAEQRVIAAARKLHVEGHSLRAITRLLPAQGFAPREGKHFHAVQISRMLKSSQGSEAG